MMLLLIIPLLQNVASLECWSGVMLVGLSVPCRPEWSCVTVKLTSESERYMCGPDTFCSSESSNAECCNTDLCNKPSGGISILPTSPISVIPTQAVALPTSSAPPCQEELAAFSQIQDTCSSTIQIITEFNEEELDGYCENCFPDIKQAFEKYNTCMEASGIEPPSNDASRFINAACTRNQLTGKYCILTPLDSFSPWNCPQLAELGCCANTLLSLLGSPSLSNICSWALPPACPPPGETVEILNGSFALTDIPWSEFMKLSDEERNAVVEAALKDLAEATGVPANNFTLNVSDIGDNLGIEYSLPSPQNSTRLLRLTKVLRTVFLISNLNSTIPDAIRNGILRMNNPEVREEEIKGEGEKTRSDEKKKKSSAYQVMPSLIVWLWSVYLTIFI